MASPSPVPPSLVVKKGLKIFPVIAGSIPFPLSLTVVTAYRSPCRTWGKRSRRTHPPGGVAWTAFLTRFQRTCFSCSESPSTKRFLIDSFSSSTPRSRASPARTASMTSPIRSAMFTGPTFRREGPV